MAEKKKEESNDSPEIPGRDGTSDIWGTKWKIFADKGDNSHKKNQVFAYSSAQIREATDWCTIPPNAQFIPKQSSLFILVTHLVSPLNFQYQIAEPKLRKLQNLEWKGTWQQAVSK